MPAWSLKEGIFACTCAISKNFNCLINLVKILNLESCFLHIPKRLSNKTTMVKIGGSVVVDSLFIVTPNE